MPSQGTKITMQPSEYEGFTIYTIQAETRDALLATVAQITMTLGGGARVEELRPHVHHGGWAELEVRDAPASSATFH